MAAGGVKADVMRFSSAKPIMLTKRGEALARRTFWVVARNDFHRRSVDLWPSFLQAT
jgi:hypothetical protein